MQHTKGAFIRRFLRGSKALFAASILSAGVAALADMINPQIIRMALDNAIGGEAPQYSAAVMRIVNAFGGFAYLGAHLEIMAAAVVVVALVNIAGQYCFRVFNTKASETLVKLMRDTLYAHIARLPYAWHMRNRTGDIIQRCTSDINTVKNFISEKLTSIFRIVILLVLSTVFMLRMDGLLTLIALAPMPVIMLYSFFFHRKIGQTFEQCDENEGKLSAMAQENLTGVRVVRAFGRERYEKDRFHAQNQYYTGLWKQLAEVMARFWSVSDILSGIQVMLVIVFGAVFCLHGRLTAGAYVAFISYNALLVWPIRQLGRMISEMSKAGVAIDRIRYIIESEPEHDRTNALRPPLTGDIAFEHVHFAYDNGPEILHDIDFTMKGGTTLGILGGTGSGKSTLMLLLDRMYDLPPSCGRITIGGVDVAEMDADYLRKNIAIVLQEPYLFSRTLSENIAITQPEIPLAEIRVAAQAACLDDTVQAFTKGYDTFVGERGVTLSGGQKQRTAIARALMQHTPILILDDSLSAVDTETDQKIRAALAQRFGTASIILISHRITTLAHADQIVVLDHGRVAEIGTHDALKSAGGIYQHIYEIQTAANPQGEGQNERIE